MIVVLAYAIIGMLVSRAVFVWMLGDAPRHERTPHKDEYGKTYYKNDSQEYDSARWHAFFAVPFWPAYLMSFYIGRPTKREVKANRLAELEATMKRIEDEYPELKGVIHLSDKMTYTSASANS